MVRIKGGVLMESAGRQVHIFVAPLPLQKKRNGTKLEKTSLSADVF